MKYHCNACLKDFTTLCSDEKTKVAFTLYYRHMYCPHCHASAHSIHIHNDCRSRIEFKNGVPEAICDGCISYFNCWTGNIDDGLVIISDIDNAISIAKQRIVLINKEKKEKQTADLKAILLKHNFKFWSTRNIMYIQHANTTWRLDYADFCAIVLNEWDTEKTKLIKHIAKKKSCQPGWITLYFRLINGVGRSS